MKLNVHIIADELNVPEDKIYVDDRYELNLNGFELADFGSGRALSRKLLYIADSSEINTFIDLLIGVNLLIVGSIEKSVAEYLKNQLCNVLIMQDITKTFVVNLIQGIFNRYAYWNERVLEACLSHKSLQEVFNIITEVLKNPLLVLDSSFTVVLTAGNVPERIENTYWEFFLPHGYSSFERLANLTKPLQYEKYIDSKEPYWFRTKKPEYCFMSVNLNLHGKSYGEITIVETYEPLTMGQLSILSHIRIAVEAHIRFFSDNAQKPDDSTYFFTQLIRGAYVEESLIASQLKKRQWMLGDRYYVLCIMKKEESVSQGIIDFYKNQLNHYFSNGIILVLTKYIVIVLREKDYPYIKNNNYKEFIVSIKKLNMACGVSQIFTSIQDLYIYYRQSRFAVKHGENLELEGNFYYFRDFYLDYFMTELKNSTRKNITCDPRVVALKKLDEKNQTEYVQTLFHYLKNGSNLQRTAGSLSIHRNTLAHRFRQIKELAGINVESKEDIDQLIISCILLLKSD